MKPHLDGILETALYVDDLDRSAKFYAEVFQFEIIDKGERLCAMAAGSRQVLLLFKKGAAANLGLPAHDGSGQSHLAFAIPLAELRHWETWLAERGVAVEQRQEWERGGVSLYFRDPDGHLLEVATPGVWSIY